LASPAAKVVLAISTQQKPYQLTCDHCQTGKVRNAMFAWCLETKTGLLVSAFGTVLGSLWQQPVVQIFGQSVPIPDPSAHIAAGAVQRQSWPVGAKPPETHQKEMMRLGSEAQ